MRSLFFKVFIIFWIAQSLIFVISTALIVRHHFNESPPDVLSDGFYSSLENDAYHATAAYESGDCPALKAYGASIGQTIALEDASGNPLCKSEVSVPPPPSDRNPRNAGIQVGNLYVWRVPFVATSGKPLSLPPYPSACASRPLMATGPAALFLPAASGSHRRRRPHHAGAGSSLYAPGGAAAQGRP